jgi:hypothetical protein
MDVALNESEKATDAKLASKISSLTKMTDDEVQELFPSQADAKKLIELMKIIKSREERNTKVTKIVSDAEKFGDIVLTLLERFV